MDADIAELRTRFTETLALRLPKPVARGLEVAAARDLTTLSEYVRRAIVAQLRSDGLVLSEANR